MAQAPPKHTPGSALALRFNHEVSKSKAIVAIPKLYEVSVLLPIYFYFLAKSKKHD